MLRPNPQIHLLALTWLANACFAVGAELPSKPPRVKPPRITLIGAARADFGGQPFFSLTLEVANPNDASLTYTGYAPDSFDPPLKADHIAPLCQIERKQDGRWQSNPKGFCGTGLGDLDLAPQSSATFVVLIPADDWQMLKVGIGHYPGWSNEEASTSTIWNTELTRAAVEIAAGRSPREGNLPVGKWRIEFANRVVETCEIRHDRSAFVVEPQRSSPGKASIQESAVVIQYDDDRVERWTTVGERQVVEHWFPASQFSSATPVLGIAERCD